MVVLAACLMLLFGFEIFFLDPHGWHKIRGIHIALGIVGAIVLMGFSKFLGQRFLYRKESYYD